ncbi:unnamed protein product, partial [Laminaria digitata]
MDSLRYKQSTAVSLDVGLPRSRLQNTISFSAEVVRWRPTATTVQQPSFLLPSPVNPTATGDASRRPSRGHQASQATPARTGTSTTALRRSRHHHLLHRLPLHGPLCATLGIVRPASRRGLAILAAATSLMSVASVGPPRRPDQGRPPPRSSSEASTTTGRGSGKEWDVGRRGESGLEATDGEVLLSAHQMADWLGEVEVHVMVDVILVGFHERDGAGGGGGGFSGSGADAAGAGNFVALDAAVVQEYLSELARGLSTDGAGGVPITVVDQGRENEVTRLGIRQETLFEVSHAPPSLALQVTRAVESAIRTARTDGGSEEDPAKARHESTAEAEGTVGVPRTAIDNAIRSHHVGESVSYSLYLLHPNAEGDYHYIHETSRGGADVEGGAGGERPGDVRDGSRGRSRGGSRDTSPGGCGYVGWVGEHQRYAWLDLGAYVSSGWGPRKRAFGAVSPSTLPSLSAAGRGRGNAWLSSELAGLAYRTASQLIVPPFLFTPAGLSREDFSPLPSPPVAARWSDYQSDRTGPDDRSRDEVVVHLFLVCDVDPCPARRVRAWAGLDELLREPESGGDRRGGDRLMPRVTVELEQVVLWEHPHLAAGIQQAVQSPKGGPSSAAPGGVSLAAAELRHWLRLFLAGRARGRDSGSGRSGRGGGGKSGTHGDGSAERVVPLFVMNLDTEVSVLLDHSARSTAYPDMVVSVTGLDGTAADSMFGCGGQRVMIGDGAASSGAEERQDSDGLSPRGDDGVRVDGEFDAGFLRDTVASLAQIIWGAPPRSLSWDPVSDRLSTDFLWATGASLHTPLSSHSSLTFTERDAYPRTHVLRKVDAAVGAARDVLGQAAAAEPRLSLALYGGDHALVVEHWRGVQESLGKCLDELAVHHHESAERFADVLESHVARLGAALSQGFGDGMYRATCDCRAAANGPEGFTAGDSSVG